MEVFLLRIDIKNKNTLLEKIIGNEDKLKKEVFSYICENYKNFLSKCYSDITLNFINDNNIEKAVKCWNDGQSIKENCCFISVKKMIVED